jgi:hypothetical protein
LMPEASFLSLAHSLIRKTWLDILLTFLVI